MTDLPTPFHLLGLRTPPGPLAIGTEWTSEKWEELPEAPPLVSPVVGKTIDEVRFGQEPTEDDHGHEVHVVFTDGTVWRLWSCDCCGINDLGVKPVASV